MKLSFKMDKSAALFFTELIHLPSHSVQIFCDPVLFGRKQMGIAERDLGTFVPHSLCDVHRAEPQMNEQ